MNEFLTKVAEILEVEEVTPDFRFRAVSDWDSMKAFSLIVLLESDYGKTMDVATFQTCETVGDLARFVGIVEQASSPAHIVEQASSPAHPESR